MQTIIATRHPLKFYGALVIIIIISFALGTVVLWTSIGIISEGQVELKTYAMPLFSLVFFSLALLMILRYYQNVPKIKIDSDSISFNDQIFHLKDIKAVKLTGKVPFPFVFDIPHEGTTLIFMDGTKKVFFDEFYQNSAEMKSFIYQKVVKKQDYIESQSNTAKRQFEQYANSKVYKGNQFTSLRGIVFWAMILFAAFFIFNNYYFLNWTVLISLFIFGVVWFIFNSFMMNYFEISQRFLVVKSHNSISKSKVYELSTIKEVVFEVVGRGPNSMRIITEDFQNKLFAAATLRDHTWLEMKKELESKGIKVRDECIKI